MSKYFIVYLFFFSSRRRHTRWNCDWSSDVCSSDLLRRTLRDLLAVVEHGYALRCAHHDLHVVLDQENRDRALLAERADEGEERGGFLWVHPGGRLVEEQQLRLGRERAGDLEPTLVAVGEVLCELVVRSSQPREGEQLARLLLGLALLAPDAGQPEDRAEDAALQAGVHADQHVLERRHLREQADVLERATDAELRDRVRRLLGDVDAVEDDRSGRSTVEHCQHVEEGRLAGPVRPDQE